MSYRLPAAIVFAIVGALALPCAHAGEVEPGFLVVELVPGRQSSFQLKVKTKDSLEKLWAQPVDFMIDRKGQFVIGDLQDKRYSGKAWCKLKPTELVLTRDRELILDVPMLAPAGTAGGEYYLGIQFVRRTATPQPESGLSVKTQVNMLAIAVLKVSGHSPKIAGEVIDPTVTLKDSSADFQATFHNLSTVALVARSAVVIRDPEQKIIDRVLMMGAGTTEKDGQVFMQPDGLRDFAAPGNRKLPPGKYTAEFFSVFGLKKIRAVKTIDFEVVGGNAKPVPPLDDIVMNPPRVLLEMTSGAVKYPVLEFKNRGFNPIDVVFKTDQPGVTFFPATARLEPGRVVKIRTGIRLPPAENPRRDIPIQMAIEEGADKSERTFTLQVYAPGTIPKDQRHEEDVKPSATPLPTEPVEDPDAPKPPPPPGGKKN